MTISEIRMVQAMELLEEFCRVEKVRLISYRAEDGTSFIEMQDMDGDKPGTSVMLGNVFPLSFKVKKRN